MRTAVLFNFRESEVEIEPTDEAGSVVDLVPPVGLSRPGIVYGPLGPGRLWAAGNGYHTTERATAVHSTRLRRSMALEAECLIPWKTTNGTYRIVTRGKGTSTAERELFGLQVVVSGAPAAPVVQVQMRWQKSSGVAAVVPAITFPGVDNWWYVAASREWISEGEVRVTYVINDVVVGEVLTTDGDITDGDGGTLMLGCDGTPTGAPAGFALGRLRITNEVRTAEELRQVYLRSFVFPEQAYESLKALLPAGGFFGPVYSEDPESIIQRELRVEADALAHTMSKRSELADDFLPDRAWSSLTRWETMVRKAPTPGERISTRRTRVMDHMSTVQGTQREPIRAALTGTLNLDADDIELFEYSNAYNDTFDAASMPGEWIADPAQGTITNAAGHVALAVQVGDDARWQADKSVLIRRPIAAPAGIEVMCALSSVALGEDLAGTGLLLWDRVHGNYHLFGITRDSGVNKWFLRSHIDGVDNGGIGGVVPAATVYWLRAWRNDEGNYEFSMVPDPADLPWEAQTTWATQFVGDGFDAAWAGAFVLVAAAPATAANSANVTAFRVWAPESRVVYQWYMRRDPALLPSDYDLKGAQEIVDEIAPLHTQGLLIESERLVCGDPQSLVGREPLGA